MTIGIGGWGARRKPMSLVREICRSNLKDLTLVSYGGPDIGLLSSCKKISKLIFGFVSLDLIPLDSHFRNARQSGELPVVVEIDEGMLQWGLRAAGMNLPFLPTRVGIGTDVLKNNPHIKFVESPYDGKEKLVAMPAIKLDVALLHVNESDEKGNTLIFGPDPFFDDLFARAASNTFVSTEKLVDSTSFDREKVANYNRFERNLVSGIIPDEGGAHPTACNPSYGIDLDHLKEYSKSAKTFDEYQEKYLFVDEATYKKNVGGIKSITSIPLTKF